jgi:uncharacterized membrane protein YjjB (DUF3815 family)
MSPGEPGIVAVKDGSIAEQCDLLLSFARVLQANGQSTHETLLAAERLSRHFNLRATVVPGWATLQLQATGSGARVVSIVEAAPTGVDMSRVAAAMAAVEKLAAGPSSTSVSVDTINAIANAPAASNWLFSIAAALGAVALSVIFGVRHLEAVALIAASAATGAVLRRFISRHSDNQLLPPLSAALLAGIVGALAVRYQLSSSLRLVAVCPCMILVPGPHVLNGMMDLGAARVSLGSVRLVYAGLVLAAISIGLLLGLGLLGISLPADERGRPVPLWLDVLAAGAAVSAYSVFFSTPMRMLAWPVAAGMLAHALRWWTMASGAGATTGTFIACLAAGLVLAPIARRFHMPFAAIGFASVVSMIPGVFLFRMASGLLQLGHGSNTILDATFNDGVTALTVILAMGFGLIIPKMIVDRLGRRGGHQASSP